MGYNVEVDINNFAEYERSNSYMHHNNIRIDSVERDHCIVRVDLTQKSKNIYGYVHGGLMYSMADCVAGLTARTDGRAYVTQSSHMNFLRNTDQGTIYAEGTAIKRGKMITVIRINVYDEKNRQLIDGVIDMMCVEK